MSLGSDWKNLVDDRRACHERSQAQVHAQKLREEADEIVATIPQLILNAGRRGETEVKIFGWVTSKDVAGTGRNKVDDLNNRRGKKALRREDLLGRALYIFEWCAEHDLEMFLKTVDIPMNEDEYDMYVRPQAK